MSILEFQDLKIKGFRSFKEEQNFKLNREPGLYFITGKNYDDERLGANGVGKAQPLTSKILTPTGWKLMGEMKVGDRIIGIDGKTHNVIGVFPQGIKDIYKITFSDRSSTRCCEDHLWEVKNLNNHRYITDVKSLKELNNSKLIDNCKQSHHKFFIPLLKKPTQFIQSQVLPINPYILGVFLGDGGITETASFTTSDLEIKKYIENNIPDNYKLRYNNKYGYTVTKKKRLSPTCLLNKNIIVEQLKTLNLFGLTSHNKFIPEIYKFATIENRIELLQGLLDTDGSPNRNSVEYSSTSKHLIKDVKELVQSMGGTATENSRITKCNTKFFLSYRLYIKLPKTIQPFKLIRKLKKYNQSNNRLEPIRAIVSITPDRREETQCIMTDAPRGLYITDDYIVTHNTSIWDALIWCLEGKTILGLRGAVIKNSQSDSTLVSTILKKDGEPYIITRTHSPNSLTISPPLIENGQPKEIITQTDLDEFLGINYEKLLYTLVVGQLNSSFLDLGATEKLNLFSNIMTLSFWEQRSKAASTKVIEFQNSLNLLAAKQEGIRSKVLALKAEEGHLRASSEQFENNRKLNTLLLKQQIKEQFEEVQAAEQMENKYARYEIQHQDQIIAAQDCLSPLQIKYKETETKYREFISQLEVLTVKKKSANEEFSKWKKLDICPYCEQNTSTTTIANNKTKATKKVLLFTKLIKEITIKIEWQVCSLQKIQEDINNLEQQINSSQKTLQFSSQEKIKASTDKKLKSQILNQSRAELITLEKGIDPYLDLLNNCKIQVSKADEELTTLEQEIENVNKSLLGTQFWTKGFKELRLWLVSDALAALEIESNNVLGKLGLPEWQLKFQMERETTTGGISKGFHVLVKNSTSDKEFIQLEAFSGGERQRLKLAAIVGLSSLIQNYKGINFNIEIWDEPSSFLSGEGIEDLIGFLQEKALESNKVIFFIDQRELENAMFKNKILVEKHKDGAKIIE